MNANPPFYHKLSLNLLTIGILAVALFLGRDIVIPIFFAILLATLLLPVAQKLKERGLPDSVSILLPLLLFFIVSSAIIFFLSYQVVVFFDDLPEIKEKINEMLTSIQRWLNNEAQVTFRKQNQYMHDLAENAKEESSALISRTFTTLTDVVSYVVLLPVYTFLILYYRNNIKSFLVQSFRNGSEKKVNEVLTESTTVAQHYVLGLGLQTSLVLVLNAIGFLILGIKYAVFLALLAALLNLIPYVGMLIANIISMLITLISSGDPTNAIWVGVILLIVQIIDNNFAMPIIVGNKVKINALATIVGVLVGGALCGVPGMFLAIPGLAVLKVIFDRVPSLNAWSALLSDRSANGIEKTPAIKK